ncbi:hypothetical protein LCGC14_2848300 [marine sediment metagenome]|uniref:Uncharacterized protein n=1 Tax=marine sediment metagenome TaxID=412755 RepID=A0A0F9AHJ7_9ZZZZ
MTTVADQLVTALGKLGEAQELAEKWANHQTKFPDNHACKVAADTLRICGGRLRAVLRGKENDG